jgi:hypothetical protein
VPVSEWGKGAGHPYGKPVIFTASDGKKYSNTYYGRGYVQLTWDYNYLAIGKDIGLGEALAINADKALDPAIAYPVMSYGMRNGTFTTRKLSDYISGTTCDYYHARRIINGLANAAPIADCARQIERLILLTVPQFIEKPVAASLQTVWA